MYNCFIESVLIQKNVVYLRAQIASTNKQLYSLN